MLRRSGHLPLRAALVSGLTAAVALAAPAVSSAQLGDKTLRKGSSGPDVKQLQRALRDAGYRTAVDGEYGNDTVKRVKAFEGNEQLKVDGVMTPSDQQKLEATTERGKDGEAPAPGGAAAPDGDSGGDSGSGDEAPAKTAPGSKASVGSDGLAVAPANAPEEVKEAIAAGNEIAKTPYVYGGGHGKSLKASGYDCSGSISYALRKAGIFKSAMASGPMMKFGESGKGQWITLYANAGHAYMVIAGIRFDTSARKQDGTRWSEDMRSSSGYTVRHPEGF
jgi:peptidoglycan hydrolase-like protein with peptidoglycan-binding domain